MTLAEARVEAAKLGTAKIGTLGQKRNSTNTALAGCIPPSVRLALWRDEGELFRRRSSRAPWMALHDSPLVRFPVNNRGCSAHDAGHPSCCETNDLLDDRKLVSTGRVTGNLPESFMQVFKYSRAFAASGKRAMVVCSAICLAATFGSPNLLAQVSLCQSTIGGMNKQFSTTNGLDKSGNLPLDSGLIVHTIHGPGTGAAELNLKKLNALTVDSSKTCGAFMNLKPPVYLPWCGSNLNPVTHLWDDSTSWTYIRNDTLINGRNKQRPDEVVCDDVDNKKYGLIFSNAYMNDATNLGCMYPLDGDTGNRTKIG